MLEINVIFAIISGGIISILIPKLWQNSRQKFENKVNVINELQSIFKTHQKARQFIHNKINHKYFEFKKNNLTNDKPSIELLPRQIPIKESLVEYYEEFRRMDASLAILSQAYVLLFGNKETDKLTEKRDQRFGQLVVTYFEMCHTEKSSKEAVSTMNPTLSIIDELKSLETKLILEYVNSFSFIYRLKKKLCIFCSSSNTNNDAI